MLHAFVREEAADEHYLSTHLWFRWSKHLWIHPSMDNRGTPTHVRQSACRKPTLCQVAIDIAPEAGSPHPIDTTTGVISYEDALAQRTAEKHGQGSETHSCLVTMDNIGPEQSLNEAGTYCV
jgi:hypothetical protein